MLDAPAGLRNRAFLHRHTGISGLHPVQHRAIAQIANGVDGQLHPVTQGIIHHRARRVGLHEHQATVRRIVRIRVDKRGAARAQRAVCIELHRARGDLP